MTQPDNLATIKPQATSHSHNSVLVSVIIPAYNTAQYIHRAIGSSLIQTHRNVEVLVIDDGSTDDTLRVARYFAGTDSRIRVLTQENAGVSAARNYGIREAHGEYLYFLDSDDWLEPDAIETLLDAQSEHPDCVICANIFATRIEGSTALLYVSPVRMMMPPHNVSLREIAATYCGLEQSDVFHHLHAKLFRAPVNTKFLEGCVYAEDAAFFIEYFMQSGGKAYYINKPVLNVFERKGSVVRGKYNPQIFTSLIEAYKIIIGLADDDEIKQLMLASLNIRMSHCLVWSVRYRAGLNEINRIKSALRSSAWLTIKRRNIPLGVKLKLILGVYAPLPVYKAVVITWNWLKSLRGEKRHGEEVIPNWQDFPKAPCE